MDSRTENLLALIRNTLAYPPPPAQKTHHYRVYAVESIGGGWDVEFDCPGCGHNIGLVGRLTAEEVEELRATPMYCDDCQKPLDAIEERYADPREWAEFEAQLEAEAEGAYFDTRDRILYGE